MELPAFQQSVAHFVRTHALEISVEGRLVDLVSETGELAKEVLKATQYGKNRLEPTKDWESELGDVFLAVICMANSAGVNLEKVLQEALDKYQERLAQKGDLSSGG